MPFTAFPWPHAPEVYVCVPKFTGLANNDTVAYTDVLDSSGNANHATGAAGTGSCVYKTNIANGQPAILFDGERGFTFPAVMPNAKTYTKWAVVKFTVTNTVQAIWCDGTALVNKHLLYTAGDQYPILAHSGPLVTSSIGVGTSTFHLLVGTAATNFLGIVTRVVGQVWVDGRWGGTSRYDKGELWNTDTSLSLGGATGLAPGTIYGFSGYFLEGGVFKRGIGGGVWNDYKAYLADRFGL